MTQNVSQWLDEIKTLKQRLAEAQQEREEAYASAINWQRLYETEAQQRRLEAHLARQAIAELQQLKSGRLSEDSSATATRIETSVKTVRTETELRSHLVNALAECDRLTKALQTEQENHIQTRKSLTTALGDAIDALKNN